MERYKELSQLLPFILGGLLIIGILALAFGRQPEKEVEGEEGMFSDLVDFFTGSEVVEENFLESVQTGAETSIDISHSHGNIIVRGWDEDEVRIEGVKIVKAVDEETARKIISLPREVGEIDEENVVASIGRFGPYLKKGTDFRSIPKDKDLFDITLQEAKEIYAQEKKGRGARSKKVLKELGADPKTEKPVQVLDGRYGPYVSNGTRTFASLPKDTKPEDVTLGQALEWIKEKKSKKKKK